MTDKNHLQEQANFIFRGLWLGFLTFLPVFIGLVVMTLTANMGTLGFSLGAFISGFSGVIILVRKEIPTGLNRIRGTMAIIEGLLFIVLCWGSAIFLLIEGLK